MAYQKLLQALTQHRDRNFFIAATATQTYGDFWEKVERFYNLLHPHQKNMEHSYIAIEAFDLTDFLAASFALWQLNKTVIPLPWNIQRQQLETIRQQLPSFHLLRSTSSSCEWDEKELSPSNKSSLVIEQASPKGPNQLACIIMTSGSSGAPKGVALSFENLYQSAIGTNQFYHINERDCWAQTLPHHHIGGLMISLRCLLVGASVYYHPTNNWRERLSPQATLYSFVPAQLYDIIRDKKLLKSISGARAILLGGAPGQASLFKKIRQHDLPVALTYGQSEMSAQVSSTAIGQYDSGHVGKALPGRNIEIDSEGKVVLFGPTLFQGHFREGELIKPFSYDGKYTTSDLGKINSCGELTISGRADRIFISGGENINPEHIETFYQNKIDDPSFGCHVKAFEDDKFGQVPALLYYSDQLKELNGRDFLDAKIMGLAKRLPAHQRPKHITPLYKREIQDIKIPIATIDNQWELYQKLQALPLKTFIHGDTNAPAIVFVHGFMGSRRDFYPLWNSLTSKSCFVAIELPGHGRNPNISETQLHSFQEVCFALAQTLKAVQEIFFHPITLLGYSMGGRLSMQTLIDHPQLHEKIAQLIIVSASPGLSDSDQKRARQKSDQMLLANIEKSEHWQEFLQSWYQQPLFGNLWHKPSARAHLEGKLAAELAHWGVEGLRQRWQQALELMSVSEQKNLWPKLSQLPSPCYFIYGEDDFKYAGLSVRMTSQMLNEGHIQAQAKGLDGGHAPHLEDPEQVADFLELIT